MFGVLGESAQAEDGAGKGEWRDVAIEVADSDVVELKGAARERR